MHHDGEAAIVARDLEKRYGKVVALDGLDLTVPYGSVLGLLGPNGAGKTTAVSILATLLIPDGGTARVAGADVIADPETVRRSIGLSGQFAAVDEVLTGRENLQMIGRLYRMGRSAAKKRATELLERFGLADAADRPVKTYSGGMRRRLDLAGALVAEPPVLFLDEPTTGLDPRSRIDLWAVIRELVGSGSTLLLTTQYLEEADQLADDIVVIDQGRAIAQGTSDELKARVGGERIELVVGDAAHVEAARAVVAAHTYRHGEVEVKPQSRTLFAPVEAGIDTLGEVIAELRRQQIPITDIGLRRPTLDDVFLTLTGHDTKSGGSPAPPSRTEVPA